MSLFTNGCTGRLFAALLICSSLILAGCGGGGGGGSSTGVGGAFAIGVNQAAYQPGTTQYVYGLNSIPNIPIDGAPADADFERWAMLHDGAGYRLYCFQQGSATRIYQFGFNASTSTYEFGHDSIPELEITGAPADANPASFAMLHDGRDYRLYMRGTADPRRLYQFAFNPSTSNYEYGFRSIDAIDTTGAPADADFSRWAMLYDGTTYRQYVMTTGSSNVLYQFGFDGRSYAFGHSSIAQLEVTGMPGNSYPASFAMLHDGSDYRFYQQSR